MMDLDKIKWPDFPEDDVSASERARRAAGGTPLFRAMYEDLEEIIGEWDSGFGWNDTGGIAAARATLRLIRAALEREG